MAEADVLAEYDAVRQRVSVLAREHPGLLDADVPACPAWRARDVIAHLAGLADDLVEQRLDGYGSTSWTDGHVRRYAGRPIDDVLDEWERASSRLGEVAPLGGVPAAAMAFGDAVVHEADLRAALAPGSRPPVEAVMAGVKAGVSRWRPVLDRADAPTLRIEAVGQRDFLLGRADDRAQPVVLRADPYELFRLLFGRRSTAQVLAMDWSGDPESFLGAGLPYPFTWAASDVHE